MRWAMRIKSDSAEVDFVEVGASVDPARPLRVRVGETGTVCGFNVTLAGAAEIRKAMARVIREARRKAAKK